MLMSGSASDVGDTISVSSRVAGEDSILSSRLIVDNVGMIWRVSVVSGSSSVEFGVELGVLDAVSLF